MVIPELASAIPPLFQVSAVDLWRYVVIMLVKNLTMCVGPQETQSLSHKMSVTDLAPFTTSDLPL